MPRYTVPGGVEGLTVNRPSIKSAFLLPLFFLSSAVRAVENPHGELKIDCQICHTTAAWTDVRFDHQSTGFKLELSHEEVNCRRCHDLKDFSAADGECRSCHPDVHMARMGSDCGRCHTPHRWEIFDTEEIHARTRFPLLERHVLVDCRNCHPRLLEGDFATSASDCVDCHEENYLATATPPHVSLGMSTVCSECHEPVRWRPALFPSHDAAFPIFSGEHQGTWDRCGDCHPDPSTYAVFSCFACHPRPETDEKHAGIPGYSYDSISCLGCHPSGSAEGGDVGNHDKNFFPIFSGTHASAWATCAECHIVAGDFSLFSCIDCHEHDRTSMDPRHQGIPGYGYDSLLCYGCHPTGEGGNFLEHDQLYFPIYSGKHAGKWDDCTTCHINPADWSDFSCIGCHEHRQSEMDDKHSDVPDYVYDSQACYECHPNGEERIHWKRPKDIY